MNPKDYPSPNSESQWNWPAIGRWTAGAILFIAAPVYLGLRPNDYTPLVQVLLSLFLFILAYWIGYTNEVAKAAKRANDRWLPQTEGVIYRLMTLRTNVRGFSRATRTSCSSASCDLPELNDPNLKAVKIKMKSDCEASSQRLDDIARQLEDAIEDWRRFIIHNCDGEECQRIWDALQSREERLERDFSAREPSMNSAVNAVATSEIPPSNTSLRTGN
jgi:hypothetical protein